MWAVDQAGPVSTGHPLLAQALSIGAAGCERAIERGNMVLPMASRTGACFGRVCSLARVSLMCCCISPGDMATGGSLRISCSIDSGVLRMPPLVTVVVATFSGGRDDTWLVRVGSTWLSGGGVTENVGNGKKLQGSVW